MVLRSTILLPLVVLLTPSAASAKLFHVFYLGGQSNMDGYGRTSDLPADLKTVSTSVPIFHGNTSPDGAEVDGKGRWAMLRPGHGVGFQSDGQQNRYSDRFGVELTFARRLKQQLPGKNIAIVKYSRGGTSIDMNAAGRFGCWEPDYEGGAGNGQGINQYDHFLATLRHAMSPADIDGDGQPDQLVPAGIVWMQGESDASYGPEIAARYGHNLKRLIDLIRAALRADDLPVAIGRISDSGQDAADKQVWDHGDLVRQQQAAFVQHDSTAYLVTTTDSYGYSDPWHYDSDGYLHLGREFADALLRDPSLSK